MAEKHKWTFFRAGGFDQVKLESGSDLMNLDKLDKKLWVALACPTSGLEIDSRTLDLIDSDKNGRIRPGELIEAVRFAGSNLKNADDLLKGEAALPLASINDAQPEGKALLASARRILGNIGKAEASSISIEDVSDRARIFADTAFNGDGVITELSSDSAPGRAVIAEIIACMGSTQDLSGKPGVDSGKDRRLLHRGPGVRRLARKRRSGSGLHFPSGQGRNSRGRGDHHRHQTQGGRLFRALPPGRL